MNSAAGGFRASIVERQVASPSAIAALTTLQEEIDAAGDGCVLVLDGRAFDRECLAQALISRGLDKEILAIGSIEEWEKEKSLHPPVEAILFHIGSRRGNDPELAKDMERLTAQFHLVPVVVVSDTDDLPQVLKMLEQGARGFIPSSVGVSVCIQALSLAMAGGIFVPATTLQTMRHLVGQTEEVPAKLLAGMFTPRQEEVVEALRKGKANKIIAFELKLRESTVKVHIRNIMKKLKATNRTEVACKLNDLLVSAAGTQLTN